MDNVTPASAPAPSLTESTPAPKPGWLPRADVRAILWLALPSAGAFLTQTLVNLVDTVFFGRLEGAEKSNGQAMLSFSLPLLWAIGGFLSAISVGTQAIVARRMGEGDARSAGGVLPNALVAAGAGSVVVSIVGWYAIPSLFAAVSTNPEYIKAGTAYTQWRFLGLVSMVLTAAYKAYFDGTSRTYVHFAAAIGMNIVNALLCYLLIFGAMGFPRMGAEGAGIAACVSSWVGFFVMVAWSFGDKATLAPYRPQVLSASLMKRVVGLSIPSGIATTAVMTGFLLFRQIVQGLDNQTGGVESVHGAATTIIIQVLSLIFFACLAFGVATATLVSRSMGEKDPDRAEHLAWVSTRLGVLVFGVIGAVMVAFPESIVSVFNSDPLVIATTTPSLRLMAGTAPLVAIAMILTQALFGAGNTRFVMVAELILHFGWLVPAAYIFGVVLKGGLFGIWLSAALYAVLLAIAMLWKFRSNTWKEIEI